MKYNNKIIPIVTYTNIQKYKSFIIKENKEISCIYRWNDLNTGKSYIGSSKNLARRLSTYFSKKAMLNQLNKGRSIIYSALLKHGYDNFSLDILEYCEINILIEREQYYLDLLKPEYNILKVTSSRLGYKHTIDTKLKMSILKRGERNNMYNKKHTKQTCEAISLALKGKSRIGHSHTHTAITRAKIGQANIGKVLSDETKLN